MRVGDHLAIIANADGWHCPSCDQTWHMFSEITQKCVKTKGSKK